MFFRKTDFKSLSDEDLLRHITRGAEGAFTELYGRYAGRMHRFFMRMLGNDAVRCEDFTQELFLKIIEKPEAFNPERRFSSWLYTVAGNMCKNEYRRRGRTSTTDVFPELQYIPELPQKLDNMLFGHHLELALETLSDEHKQCFVLRFQEECSMKEIAEIMDCPEGTVRSRLFYTLRRLAEQLKIFQLT